MISTILTFESKWNSRLSLRINLFFWIRVRQARRSKMSEIHVALLDWISLFKIDRRDESKSSFEGKSVKFSYLIVDDIVVYSRSTVENVSTIPSTEGEWNWLLSSSTEFVFGRSTVDNFSDTAADRKVSEIDLTLGLSEFRLGKFRYVTNSNSFPLGVTVTS
jgi:hypothetical protein